jgi:hypothetical protein
MAKAKKSKSVKKPIVKVQDLTPENDPKGGFSIAETILKLADGSVRTISTTSITDGTSNTLLNANKITLK